MLQWSLRVSALLALAMPVLLALSCSGEEGPRPSSPLGARQQAQTEATTQETFSVSVPQGVGLRDAFLSATDRLFSEDRVTLGQTTTLEHVSNVGFNGLELGAGVVGANVHNAGSFTFLRSGATLRGFVRAGGSITKQNNVVVQGGEFPNTAVPEFTTRWTVAWPVNNQGPVTVNPDQTRTLAPGAYGVLDVRSRARVNLRTGTYFFERFTTEPEAQLLLDKSNGPIFIYARTQFRYHARFVENGGDEAQVLVGYLGSSNADLQVGFLGTLVAPNAEIDIRRPTVGQHKGAFFGKRIHVYSDMQVLHVPFDWGFLCSLGDSDADGVSDCSDQCARDPQKVVRGLCGCGVADTDSDGDRVPNCKDECPNDPNNVRRGQCGCAGDPDVKPAGTACTDGVCSGLQQCNGAGRCGDPAACRPEAGCVAHRFDDHTYWRCPSRPWDQALTRCDSVPGMSLVKIDGPTENAFVASTLAGSSWTGAADRTVEGAWRWRSATAGDGPQFWSGGVSGSPVDSRYANWRAGEPDGGETRDCGAMVLGGRWIDEVCSVSLPYICETSIQPTPRPTPGAGCPVPGATCARPAPRGPNCVTIQGPDLATAEAQVRACSACGSDEACVNRECVGAAARVTSGTCAPFAGDELKFCEIVPGTQVASCSSTNPGCPSGTRCGRLHRCHDVFKDGNTWRPRPCAEGCQPGHSCGSKGFCINPNLSTACDAATTEGEVCFGQCFGELVCGQVDDACADNDPDPNPCQDVEVCSLPSLGSPGLDPSSDVTNEPFDPNDVFGPPSAPVGETYPAEDPPCPVGPDGRVACDLNEAHPWCRYGTDGSLSDKPVRDSKQGSRGTDSIVQFDFDPNVELDFEGDALPFGETAFRVRAAASFKATSTFDLGFAFDTIEVVEAVAALEATRCRLSTADTRLEVFGVDFLPILGASAKLDTADAFPPDECEAAVQKFAVAAGRAKKALRDAQELVKQYEALRAQGTIYALSLCETLASDPPQNFPPLAPGVTCETEEPEDTINRFIKYAANEAAAIKAAQDELSENTLSSSTAAGLSLPLINFDKSSEETQEIVNMTFFVGPVPANLSVEAVVSYGLRGDLTFDLPPGAVLQDTDTDIIAVTANAEPFANASITMFVGAGIDFGALTVKAGIAGNVSLGEISLPAYARAGVRVHPEDDPRPVPGALPPDLQNISTGQTAFPFDGKNKMYRYALAYRYGASFKLERILAGDIDARVKVKFAFFSKTWKKKILDFGNGFGFGTVPLLNGGAEVGVADDVFPWGLVRMPTPLVLLKPLLPAPPQQPVTKPQTTEVADAELDSASTPVNPTLQAFDTGRVEELFYDSLCTCKQPNESCHRNADCCPEAPVCFNDPATGNSVCSGCRGTFSSCNVHSDCCAGACVSNVCLPCVPHGSSCSESTPAGCCNTDDQCFTPLGQPASTCTCVPSGQPCRSLDECCSGSDSCSDPTPGVGPDTPICRRLVPIPS